jgi:hypothetical protein
LTTMINITATKIDAFAKLLDTATSAWGVLATEGHADPTAPHDPAGAALWAATCSADPDLEALIEQGCRHVERLRHAPTERFPRTLAGDGHPPADPAPGWWVPADELRDLRQVATAWHDLTATVVASANSLTGPTTGRGATPVLELIAAVAATLSGWSTSAAWPMPDLRPPRIADGRGWFTPGEWDRLGAATRLLFGTWLPRPAGAALRVTFYPDRLLTMAFIDPDAGQGLVSVAGPYREMDTPAITPRPADFWYQHLHWLVSQHTHADGPPVGVAVTTPGPLFTPEQWRTTGAWLQAIADQATPPHAFTGASPRHLLRLTLAVECRFEVSALMPCDLTDTERGQYEADLGDGPADTHVRYGGTTPWRAGGLIRNLARAYALHASATTRTGGLV